MKKIILFLLTAFIAGCSDDTSAETPDNPTNPPETVVVSLAMTGDITVDQIPLNRAIDNLTDSKDIYGISVYYDKYRNGRIDTPYGYGLFDNVADMSIPLLTGYKYKFICSLVKDGKDKLGQYSVTDSYGTSNYQGYCFPFCKSSQEYKADSYNYSTKGYYYKNAATKIENQFIVGEDDHLTGLGQGYTHGLNLEPAINLQSGYEYFPQTDRYYGEVTNFSPKENSIIGIELKRCVFGVKFNITGISDGKFSYGLGGPTSPNEYTAIQNQNQSGITTDIQTEGSIYTFCDVYECWKGAITANDYSATFVVWMYWERDNGIVQELPNKEITIKRNMMNVVNIKLDGGKTTNRLNLNVENTPMGETEINLDVDAGGVDDTPVNPNE